MLNKHLQICDKDWSLAFRFHLLSTTPDRANTLRAIKLGPGLTFHYSLGKNILRQDLGGSDQAVVAC